MSGKTQTENIISKIFKLNKKIRFVAIISDNGKILYSEMKFDKNSLLKQENDFFCFYGKKKNNCRGKDVFYMARC